MAPGISYDESGSLANYFGVTFLALVLVPVTYFSFKPDRKGESLCTLGVRIVLILRTPTAIMSVLGMPESCQRARAAQVVETN
jgi:hypothetical protein